MSHSEIEKAFHPGTIVPPYRAPRCGIYDPEGRDLRFASTGAVNMEQSAERRTPATSRLKVIAACY